MLENALYIIICELCVSLRLQNSNMIIDNNYVINTCLCLQVSTDSSERVKQRKPYLLLFPHRVYTPWPSPHRIKGLIPKLKVQCHWRVEVKLDQCFLRGQWPLKKVWTRCESFPVKCRVALLHWCRLNSWSEKSEAIIKAYTQLKVAPCMDWDWTANTVWVWE